MGLRNMSRWWHFLALLNRGGNDPLRFKMPAYKTLQPESGWSSTKVIPLKTVKANGMGAAGEGKNIAHNVKKNGYWQR